MTIEPKWHLLMDCLEECGIEVTWDLEGYPGVDLTDFHKFNGERPLTWSDPSPEWTAAMAKLGRP